MQYVKLNGGLGNQIFQYSFSLFLKKKGHDVKLDKFIFQHYDLHKISIQNFNLNLEFAKWQEVKKFYLFKSKFFNNKLKIFSNALYIFFIKIFNINYINANFLREKKKIQNDSYFDDYWQNLKYVEPLKSILKKKLKISNPKKKHLKLLKKIKAQKNSVAIHVRVYTSVRNEDKYHGNLEKDYFDKAVKQIRKKIKKPFFFIFSNKYSEIKKKIDLKKNEFEVVKDFQDFEDLISFSNCKHQIISNSTFGWWAAWLNSNKSKIVLYPNKWFKLKKIPKNLFPRNWQKIR